MGRASAIRHWRRFTLPTVLLPAFMLVSACRTDPRNDAAMAGAGASPVAESTKGRLVTGQDIGLEPQLVAPDASPSSVKFPQVVGWPAERMPVAPPGFAVTLYADSLENPRWIHVLPNGDVLVAESNTAAEAHRPAELRQHLEAAGMRGSSANRITRLRDADGDGRAEVQETFLADQYQPFGMLALGNSFYVANTDGLLRFPYDSALARVTGAGQKIVDLPAGGYNNHWTRNVIANREGSKLYLTVGSATNVDNEGIDRQDTRRAAVLEVKPDGSDMRVFASGLRNPNGLAWEPESGALWAAVNERDELGDELVPDYITSVKEGAFYGWPYAYWGPNEDPRRKGERPDLVARTIAPDFAVGAHSATLGLVFGQQLGFPERYRQGAFIGQHGSWNRSTFSGYQVAFVPFENGGPSGTMEQFLTGFLADSATGQVWGRPVGLGVAADGALLVADDAGNRVWRVAQQ